MKKSFRIFLAFMIFLGLVHAARGSDEITCRLSREGYLSVSEFQIRSCILCYKYSRFKADNFSIAENKTYPEMLNDTDILDSFVTETARKQWIDCCMTAQSCCLNMTALEDLSEPGWCPRTWDGWVCWPDTKPGEDAKTKCPAYSSTLSCPKENAIKSCTMSGDWRKHTENIDAEWTDYTKCAEVERQSRSVVLSLISYSISLFTLLPALIIFFFFSILQCVRVFLHRNFFISLLLHAALHIVFYTFLIVGYKLEENGVWCKILSLCIVYFTVTNFAWMFCEGFFLHRQLANAFNEESRMWLFYVIGWGIPFVLVFLLMILRLAKEDQDCWALPSQYDYIWIVPCLISLFVNAFFFIRILFILVHLLRNHPTTELTICRKAAQTGLVLVPLFGLQFLLIIYRPTEVCTLAEEYYLYLNVVLEGLQGSVVAILYCYFNGEVRAALLRSWRNLIDRTVIYGQYSSAVSSQTIQYTCYMDGSRESACKPISPAELALVDRAKH